MATPEKEEAPLIYSVWNQGRRGYDYYETAALAERANAESPRHLRSGPLGTVPTAAAWPLPPGAKLIGHGASARGRIAWPKRMFLGLGATVDRGLVGIFGLGLAAVLLWRYLR